MSQIPNRPAQLPLRPSASSNPSRFLCFGGFLRLSWWVCAAGGDPTTRRACRLTSVVFSKVWRFLGLMGIIARCPVVRGSVSSFAFPSHSPLPTNHCSQVAEVRRSRTDRPPKGRPTGFEVLGEHQPACTSALILNGFLGRVNVTLLHCSENCR